MSERPDNKNEKLPLSSNLMNDQQVIQRILHHIDNKTTDLGTRSWQEPTENYLSEERIKRELTLLKGLPLLFCPSAALQTKGAYIARDVLKVPLLVVRGADDKVRAFRNACRHRGVKVAEGSGRKSAFVCPYHAWTYGIDGKLQVIPHEHGFPDVNKCDKGLVPVKCIESKGLIFVCLTEHDQRETLSCLPELVPDGYRLYKENIAEIPANWKTVMESFLEGYHIKPTHTRSFYPVQYDNLNVIEHFGVHNRVCFPYRAIEKLRERPVSQWQVENRLTYVYQLFPNTIVTTHPGFNTVLSIEPVAPDKTIQTTYIVTNVNESNEERMQYLENAVALVNSSIDEDRAMICSAQAGLAAGANEFLEFGLFESAIVHFHATLQDMLNEHSANFR